MKSFPKNHRRMMNSTMKLLFLLFLFPALLNGQQNEASDKTTGLDLSLIAENKSIVPGEPFTVGLHIQHEPEYHTYWKNPGIVGIPTKLEWELPQGFTASSTIWPYPQLCDMVGYPCHGYQRDVTLLSIITPPEQIDSREITLKVSVTWICCAEGCYPGNKEFTLTLPISTKSEPDPSSSILIRKAEKEVPQKSKNWTSRILPESTPDQIILSFKGPAGEEPQYFFSSDGQISSDQKQSFRKTAPQTWELSIVRAQYSPQDKKNVPGILKTSLSRSLVIASPSENN